MIALEPHHRSLNMTEGSQPRSYDLELRFAIRI